MFFSLVDGFKQLLFPDNCLLCRTYLNSLHTRQFCGPCFARIKMNTPPFCLRCGRHLEKFAPESICLSCTKMHYEFDTAWSACTYAEPLDHMLYGFKYQAKTSLRKTFGTLLRNFIEEYHLPIRQFDMIVPIALHPVRLRERGYNQSQMLAQELKNYSIPIRLDILQRTRATQTQTALDAKQRWTNTEGAFRIKGPSMIADKSILLVDDLLTTGATANAAALALKAAGAAQVGILTLAVT